MALSSTIQPSILAVPYAVSSMSRFGFISKRSSTRSTMTLADSTSALRFAVVVFDWLEYRLARSADAVSRSWVLLSHFEVSKFTVKKSVRL